MNVATPLRIAFGALLFASASAIASAATLFTPIPKDAPFFVPECNIQLDYGTYVTFDATDRDATRSLQRFIVKLRFFDDIHVLLGESESLITQLDVQPGETKRFSRIGLNNARVSFAESSVREIQCSITSATFIGGATWRPGVKWKGPLLKRETAEVRNSDVGVANAASPSAAIALE